jgi:low temperature requirement protein LtrA
VSEQHLEREQRVTPLELFFDLVFVFGLTQVTTVLSHNPTWTGLAHGLLLLGALWWAWASYAWLTNLADPNDELVWGTMLLSMAAMFVAALAVPSAFGRHGVVFGVSFLIVAVMQLALYALTAHGDQELVRAILRVAPWSLGGAIVILAGGFVHGSPKSALWLVALLVGFVGPLLTGVDGWRVQPAHFVERHGLIVIIAIGESLVAIGVGARETTLSLGVIVAAVLGFIVSASFWLAYFDFFTIRAERLLADRRGAPRTALARDVYTYLHLPMVAGIVLFAFAMKTTLEHIGDDLSTVPALALCCGPALYLLAYVGIRVRVSGGLGGGRFIAGIACAALFPVSLVVPAIVALSLLAAVWISLHAYELIWWRESRAEARAQQVPAPASPR